MTDLDIRYFMTIQHSSVKGREILRDSPMKTIAFFRAV